MSYIIDEVIRVMRLLDTASKKMPKPTLMQDALAEGKRLSKTVCRQYDTVVATPYMKNVLITCGDVKQTQGPDGEWHTDKLPTGAKSKGVQFVNGYVDAMLRKYNGVEKHDYPENCSNVDPILYDIDCWNGWKPTIWDIVPGQEEEVRKGFLEFASSQTNASVDYVIDLIKRDKTLQKAIEIEWSIWPEVQASREVTAISDPFMSKKTGVSYPDYHNDSATLPDSDITWGKYEIQLVEAAMKKGVPSLIAFAYAWNVYTGYCRRQRGKGRPLIAQSRRANLVVNMVNGPEMALWKEDPRLNMAFLDEEGILKQFQEMADFLKANPDYDAYNVDGKSWDRNLGQGWVCLQDAIRYIKAQGNFTRELVTLRYCMNSRGYFVDGLNNRVYEIYGRMFSGYLDTTLGNTGANRIISRYSSMSSDKDYVKNVDFPTRKRSIKCVGDDALTVDRKGTLKRKVEVSNKKCRIVIHEDEKHARGLMFIQWRAVEVDGKLVMAYNWPRVLRSMLSKEDAKMLGPAGWTLASYQQLGKLRMMPKQLAIVLNFIAAYDQQHLMLDKSVSEIIAMVKKEDAERVKLNAKNRAKKLARTGTTAERMFNSNPNIAGLKVDKNGKVDFDRNYFAKLQKVLREVYDPEWLTRHGFKNPDLNSIK